LFVVYVTAKSLIQIRNITKLFAHLYRILKVSLVMLLVTFSTFHKLSRKSCRIHNNNNKWSVL